MRRSLKVVLAGKNIQLLSFEQPCTQKSRRTITPNALLLKSEMTMFDLMVLRDSWGVMRQYLAVIQLKSRFRVVACHGESPEKTGPGRHSLGLHSSGFQIPRTHRAKIFGHRSSALQVCVQTVAPRWRAPSRRPRTHPRKSAARS